MKKRSSKKPSESDWVRLEAMRGQDIDYSDIPELGEEFYKNAALRWPKPKVKVCLRLDPEIIDWLKAQGKGYQTRINAILAAYKEAQLRKNLLKKPTRLGGKSLTKKKSELI